MSSRARFSGSASASSKSRLKMTATRGLRPNLHAQDHIIGPVFRFAIGNRRAAPPASTLARLEPNADARSSASRGVPAAAPARSAAAPGRRRAARSEVTATPGSPQGTMAAKARRSVCTFRARPWIATPGGARGRRRRRSWHAAHPHAGASRDATGRRSPAAASSAITAAGHRLDVGHHAPAQAEHRIGHQLAGAVVGDFPTAGGAARPRSRGGAARPAAAAGARAGPGGPG